MDRNRSLIEGILRRDEASLSCFYRQYAPKLRALIALKVADPHDGEEILQDTLFGFLEALRDFRGDAGIETYLTAICRHKIIDYYRRRKLRHLVFSQFPGLEDLVSPMLTPEEHLDAATLKQKLASAFGRLLPRYAKILKAKYEDDLSVEEIARQFSISFKSAESLLFRARRAFTTVFTSL
jgi:RNA polymerase sigma-70 factor (ECF subfamily)